MKKKLFIVIALIATMVLSVYATYKKSGIFEGFSRSVYVLGDYYGIVRLSIQMNRISRVDFMIVDMANKEVFDQNYERHYVGNPMYIDQCRYNWKGVKTYPQKFLETQDIEKVDAMAGATWSCNLFKDSVKEALKKAK